MAMKYYAAMNYWTIGGFEGAKSVFDAIDDVVDMKLDGLELIFGECPREEITEDECREIAGYAEEKGVGLKSLCTAFYWKCSLASDDIEERARAVAFTEKYIKVASWLNVPNILVIPGAVDVCWDSSRPVSSYRNVWDNATESLKRLIPIAESNGVIMCLENVWNKFLLSPMEFKIFIDQFNSDHVGMYFDVGNTLLYGYSEHWIEILENRIKAVHFKNFSRDDCGGTLHGFGEELLVGDVNFEAVFAELKKMSFSGPITVEMIPFSREPNLILPDMPLAEAAARDLISLCHRGGNRGAGTQ